MLFDTLTEEEKDLITARGRTLKFAKGDAILHEGDETTSLFFIQAGAVQVRKVLDKERYKQLKDLMPGDFFGDMSFLTSATRSADVLALQDSELFEITRADFDDLVKDHPLVGLKVYRNIAVELATRLQRNNEELRRAIMWALEQMIS